MLEPRDRTLLLEQLKPPVGHVLDFAVGTTYSLDLIALLGAPLAFALLDRSDREGRLIADPVALVEALRRNADKFVVFCQAGQISIPPADRSLLTMLEGNVVGVAAKAGGVFHPKVWVLRFTGPEGEVLYRFLCGTRNLTFDRSWDTMLSLEGPLLNRKTGFRASRPLADFISALPGLAVQPVSATVAERMASVVEEIRRVDFKPPEPFEDFAFHPIGHDGRPSWPFDKRRDRLLVVSPFVSDGFLSDIEDGSDYIRLVSRADELASLSPDAVTRLSQVDVFDDAASEVMDEGKEGEGPEQEALPEDVLTGLHAKFYVADAGREAIIWTGSANATSAAYNQNVEFLVELRGKRSKCGIDEVLGGKEGEPGLADFLQPWVAPKSRPDEDESLKRLEARADRLQRALAAGGFEVKYRQLPDGSGYAATIMAERGGTAGEMEGVSLYAWPITCREEAVARPLLPDAGKLIADFGSLSTDAPTSFLAIRMDLSDGERNVPARRFTVNAVASGLPEDRHLQLLLKIVGRKDAFEEYLRMLLSGTEIAGEGDSLGSLAGLGNGDGGMFAPEQPLFEMLVKALRQEPARIDDVGRLVAEIRKSGRSPEVFPSGFDSLWSVIEEARKALAHEATPAA